MLQWLELLRENYDEDEWRGWLYLRNCCQLRRDVMCRSFHVIAHVDTNHEALSRGEMKGVITHPTFSVFLNQLWI